MRKVQVIHDKELDKMQPQATPCRMEIVLRNGEKVLGSVDHPKGHVKNPASDTDLENKFASLNNSMLSPSQVSALIGLCWRLDEVSDVAELVSLMRL
jgi:2-methylcitrate dehydratase